MLTKSVPVKHGSSINVMLYSFFCPSPLPGLHFYGTKRRNVVAVQQRVRFVANSRRVLKNATFQTKLIIRGPRCGYGQIQIG